MKTGAARPVWVLAAANPRDGHGSIAARQTIQQRMRGRSVGHHRRTLPTHLGTLPVGATAMINPSHARGAFCWRPTPRWIHAGCSARGRDTPTYIVRARGRGRVRTCRCVRDIPGRGHGGHCLPAWWRRRWTSRRRRQPPAYASHGIRRRRIVRYVGAPRRGRAVRRHWPLQAMILCAPHTCLLHALRGVAIGT